MHAQALPQVPATTCRQREDLFLLYQILAHLKLDDHIYTHVSARVTDRSFLILPFGLRFEEVTPHNLLEVPLGGHIPYADKAAYNITGRMIHSAIYEKRPDVHWIIHIHTPEITAVSACKDGLLPLSQWALHFYNRVAYHPYASLVTKKGQSVHLAQDLGHHKNMLMHNHGSLHCGGTAQEALFYAYHFQKACHTQCLALAMGAPIVWPSVPVCQQTVDDLLTFEVNLGQRDWQAWVRLLRKKTNVRPIQMN